MSEELNQEIFTELISPELPKDFKYLDFKGTQFHGDDEQRIKFMTDFSKYFAEVTNPKNTKTNPFLKNKYAPLDEVFNTIRDVMGKYGLSIMQIPTIQDDMVKVDALVFHSSGSFLAIEGLTMKSAKADPQTVGATLTYVKRYQLTSLMGVSSEEDEDGNNDSDKKSSMTQEDLSKKTLSAIQSTVTVLAKAKMQNDKKAVEKLIADTLGKKVAETVEGDKENLIKLYTSLNAL